MRTQDAMTATFLVKQFGQFLAMPEENIQAFIKRPTMGWADPLSKLATVGLKVNIPMRELLSYKWPRTWWDAAKERWAPAWAYGRWGLDPVQYDTIALHDAITNLAIPRGQGPQIKFMVLKNGGVSYERPHPDDESLEREARGE